TKKRIFLKIIKEEKIDINYHVVFEDKNVLNILIYKDIYIKNKKYERIKDSYVFDLKTGQRIYLDNFLKNNQDYKDTIENYIINDIKRKNIEIDKNRIKIDKYTNYYITNEGICVYFNPYQISDRKNIYDFKIPVTVFNNKIKDINTNPIVAQIDTQTITKNNIYLNSIINVPIIITENKNIEKNINELIKNDIMDGYFKAEEEAKNFWKIHLKNI
ncbi:RsiV family protein, partial [Paraclostridium sp. AKS73]|uniref:RsiV family protein n=1 Tax=Paraclostridium sp. AKS73 TaxID=2876116 RepID=UPI0021E031DF